MKFVTAKTSSKHVNCLMFGADLVSRVDIHMSGKERVHSRASFYLSPCDEKAHKSSSSCIYSPAKLPACLSGPLRSTRL